MISPWLKWIEQGASPGLYLGQQNGYDTPSDLSYPSCADFFLSFFSSCQVLDTLFRMRMSESSIDTLQVSLDIQASKMNEELLNSPIAVDDF